MDSHSFRSLDMSFDPWTSVDPRAENFFENALEDSSQSLRQTSFDSYFSLSSPESSPDLQKQSQSFPAPETTPKLPIPPKQQQPRRVRKVIRQQTGPPLLPRIRPQDQAIETPPTKRRKTDHVSAASSRSARASYTQARPNPPASTFRPSHTRSHTAPNALAFLSHMVAPLAPRLSTPAHSRASSAVLCSPNSPPRLDQFTFTPKPSREPSVEFRRASTTGLEMHPMATFSTSTYRSMPVYTTTEGNAAPGSFHLLSTSFYGHPMVREPTPVYGEFQSSPVEIDPRQLDLFHPAPMYPEAAPSFSYAPKTTTLLSYLHSRNPAPEVIEQLVMGIHPTHLHHYWWDVRQLEEWKDFSIHTITSDPYLAKLLDITIPVASFGDVPESNPTDLKPKNERQLEKLCGYYMNKVNAALSVLPLARGESPLEMKSTLAESLREKHDPADCQPAFISTSPADPPLPISYGKNKAAPPQQGRVVGLVKSYGRWNSGMKNGSVHEQIDYCRGLAHLQYCMRQAGCRYGFIMSEIEIVFVRNGTENRPNFGFLEVQVVSLEEVDEAGNPVLPSGESVPEGEKVRPTKMTALLGLFYLHLLASDKELDNKVHWKSDIGAPIEGSRQKHLPCSLSLPRKRQEPEKRCARNTRGWIDPHDPISTKEKGSRKIDHGSYARDGGKGIGGIVLAGRAYPVIASRTTSV